IVSSIQCYGGTDTECMLLPDMRDCGDGEVCQCAKYYFQCTQGDGACSQKEQSAGIMKWAYAPLGKNMCIEMQKYRNVYRNLTCCGTNGCNRPANAKCSLFQSRRRALRKLTKLLDLE
ncbi:unnamed protein product, partial [Rotaria socialis]